MFPRVTAKSTIAAFAAVVVLSMTACGGSTSDEASDSDEPSTVADVSDDRIADLRASATLAEGAFQGLSAGNQLCMLNTIAADDELGDALIAGDESPGVQLSLMRVLLECDGAAALQLISGGDGSLDQLSEQEFTCLVDSMLNDNAVLADAVSGTGALISAALIECAPGVAVADIASELGITTEQATCLLTSESGFLDALLAGDMATEEETVELIEVMAEVAIECGLESLFGISTDSELADDEFDDDDTLASDVDQAFLNEKYAECADGDLQACDDLYLAAPFGSDEEEFGRTCGNTSDSEYGGNCINFDVDYRENCAAGDMEACDQLFYFSEVGSDDENFGATCGGTSDGTTAGLCSDPES